MARSMKKMLGMGSVVGGAVAVGAVVAATQMRAPSAPDVVPQAADAAASTPVAVVSDTPCELKAVPALPAGISNQLRQDLSHAGPSSADSTGTPLNRAQAIATAQSNSSASDVTGLPAAAAELRFKMAASLAGDAASAPSLPDGTSTIAASRCVWMVTIHGAFVPDSGPSNEARLAHSFNTYTVIYDELSGTEVWLNAGPSAPDLISGANVS